MITASHNPVSDSGIKVFDSKGFKTNPELEREISELVVQLAAEEREVDSSELAGLEKPDSVFDADSAHQKLLKIRYGEFSEMFAPISPIEIVLDSSKGAASSWLAGFLSDIGINANEVSTNAPALNENCGAGELKPTDSWTWDEAEKSEHIMIKSLEIKSAGQIIAAALDGDGDRCLLIESTEDGCKVVDGDEMADRILRSAKGDWHLAASIESDLALASSLGRLNAEVRFSQTAVGDRWLSHALKDSGERVLGVEDSGHLVLSGPNPNGGRVLVGDGVASMLVVLCAMSCTSRVERFQRGFKHRISISPSKRSKWNGRNSLSDEVEAIANHYLDEMNRSSLVGEPNLMLLEKDGISIGIRNSGTQAKTNVSLRVAAGVDHTAALDAVMKISNLLRERLQN
jgi:phosphoglucosamine mutase